jgi:two-component system, OmpR family, sensor kinase
VLGVVAVTLVGNFASSYERVAARGLAQELSAFARAAAARPARQTLEVFSISYLHTHALASGGAVLVTLTQAGRIQTAGSQSLERSPVIASLLAHPRRTSVIEPTTVGRTPVELAYAPLLDGSRVVGSIIVTADLSAFAAERSRVLELSLVEAGIALLFGTAGAYLLLRQLLRTIGRITSTADELGRSNLDQRLGERGRDDEVGDLARTFDEMLDRIQSTMLAQRRLMADVSHQLRTPLTVARGHLEVLGRTGARDPEAVHETIELAIDEISHMSAMVERLLMLGHAMDPEFLDLQPVDLRALLGDCLAASRVLADRRFTLGPVPDVVVVIDEAKVRGALMNLVSNAVNASAEGDPIHLGASRGEDGSLALFVDDAGPGIAPDARALAFGRFARLGSTHSGTGLGLAIVKAVSEAHGGGVTIEDSPLGGARVIMVLPPSRVVAGSEAR